MQGREPWCAHCAIDDWVTEAQSFNISFDKGLLFPKLTPKASINHESRWVSKDLTETLRRDLERYHLYEGETPHSFRHGGTVDSLKKGKSLADTMYTAYMKDKRTAAKYSKGLRVLYPKGFDWKDALEEDPIDETQLTRQMMTWKAFSATGSVL